MWGSRCRIFSARKWPHALSAGRVQSVAVKLIVDREREIEAFKTEEYWKITALLAKAGSGIVWAADPTKSKILAKKKEAAKKVEWHKPTEEDTQGDDEPVVDTETSDTPQEGEEAAGHAARGGRNQRSHASEGLIPGGAGEVGQRGTQAEQREGRR